MKNKTSHIVVKKEFQISKKYFNNIVLPAFSKIKAKMRPIKKNYSIAGKNICLYFYSKTLYEKICLSLSHNEIKKTKKSDLTIYLWDTVSTGVHFSPFWKNYKKYTYDVNKKANTDGFFGVYFDKERALNLYDEKNKVAHFWIYDASEIPFWIVAAPLQTILNWFYTRVDSHLVHGAAVGVNGKSVLITAKGGSGKSTTAISCLLSGMDYFGDDHVIIESDEIIKTHSLFNSVTFFPFMMDQFPELRGKIWNKNSAGIEDRKAVVFLSESFPEQIVKTAPLSAIMIPVIKNIEKTKITKATKLQAMIAMIPTTLFQFNLMEVDKITKLKKIIERTPCYFLELGSNVREVPEAIKSFLLYESK